MSFKWNIKILDGSKGSEESEIAEVQGCNFKAFMCKMEPIPATKKEQISTGVLTTSVPSLKIEEASSEDISSYLTYN